MFWSVMEIKGSTLVISLTLYFLEYMGLNRFLFFRGEVLIFIICNSKSCRMR